MTATNIFFNFVGFRYSPALRQYVRVHCMHPLRQYVRVHCMHPLKAICACTLYAPLKAICVSTLYAPLKGGQDHISQKLYIFFVTSHNFFSLSSVQIIIIPACCLLCVL